MLLHPNQPQIPQLEDITGFDPDLHYIGFIGGGGQGDVYLVTTHWIYPVLILAGGEGCGQFRGRVLLTR